MRRWVFFFLFVSFVLFGAPQGDQSKITRDNALWNACTELYEGMPRENAKSVFETHKLGSPNQWAAAGNGEPYESWYWHSPYKSDDADTKEYSSLRVDTKNNKVANFTCYVYNSGKLEGHRCIASPEDCQHFNKETARESIPTKLPTPKLQWLK